MLNKNKLWVFPSNHMEATPEVIDIPAIRYHTHTLPIKRTTQVCAPTRTIVKIVFFILNTPEKKCRVTMLCAFFY